MSYMSEGKGLEKVSLIVTMIGIIIAVITIYIAIKKLQGEDLPWDPNPPDPPPQPDPPPDPVPGTPQLWAFYGKAVPPANQVSAQFSQPVHCSTIAGVFSLVDTKPGAWLKKAVGVTVYVIDEPGGTLFPVQTIHPSGGMRSGWHPFSATVGLDDIKHILIHIDRYYGFGDKVYKLETITGEALVVV